MLFALILCVVLVAAAWPFLARITTASRRLDEPGAGLLRVHETLLRDIALVRGGHAPEEAARAPASLRRRPCPRPTTTSIWATTRAAARRPENGSGEKVAPASARGRP